jgi:hypothetical protein
LVIDAGSMYVVGFDSPAAGTEWRIEKRSLTSGALVAAFDGDGVVTSGAGAGTNIALGVARDGFSLFVTGTGFVGPGDLQARIEKRLLSSGALVTSFAGDGDVVSNPSAGDDQLPAIAVDASFLYLGGYDSSPGNTQWRMEQRIK